MPLESLRSWAESAVDPDRSLPTTRHRKRQQRNSAVQDGAFNRGAVDYYASAAGELLKRLNEFGQDDVAISKTLPRLKKLAVFLEKNFDARDYLLDPETYYGPGETLGMLFGSILLQIR
jgi:hypothetical protein